jgi:hypothetical protein
MSILVLFRWTNIRIPDLRGNPMRHLHARSQSNHVTALFADRALSFELPKGATFEDLVDRLTFLGGREPLAVIVGLGPQPEQEFAAPFAGLPA